MCQGCVERYEITPKAFRFTERFLKAFPNSGSGPAHIVIEDNNYQRYNIVTCLENLDKNPYHHQFELDEQEATRKMLLELFSWPTEDRLGPNAFYPDWEE